MRVPLLPSLLLSTRIGELLFALRRGPPGASVGRVGRAGSMASGS